MLIKHKMIVNGTAAILINMLLLSCNQSLNQKNVPQKDTVAFLNVGDTLKHTIKDFGIDSNNFLLPDFFPVTDEMIDRCRNAGGEFLMTGGNLKSVDQAWFRNRGLETILVIGMYTDGFRTSYICFRENEIPDGVTEALEIIKGFDIADISLKRRHLGQFIGQSQEMGSSFCRSAKAFQIGENCRQRAIKIYGSPDSNTSEGKFNKLYWHFQGELSQLKNQGNKKPYAKESYGYTVEMFFSKERLVALILSNEIP